MLPIVLVLLVATNALAAPSVLLELVPINEVSPPERSYSGIAESLMQLNDNGELSVLVDLAKAPLISAANISPASTLGQAIAVMGATVTGIPGDACAAASLIDSYVNGNGVGRALANFIQGLIGDISNIVKLTSNSNALKYVSGSRGNCAGGGRTFAFEQAWDNILGRANSNIAGLVNEEYCAAKRLYDGYSVIDNNVAAYITAASLPPAVQVFSQCSGPLINFAGSVNPGTASRLQQCLARAANL